MYKDKKILAIIPARANSKRLPNKNKKILGTKPLIAWTIEAANNSSFIDEVIVSTDSNDIIDIAKEFGAKVPFKRPSELALDNTKSIDVVSHAIEFYKKEKDMFFDYVILLQPTSPFRNNIHIDDSIELLFSKNADCVISVCKAEHSPVWSNTLLSNASLEGFLDEKYINSRSQDFDDYYRLNGAIYICDTKRLEEENTFFIKNNIYAYKMSNEDSVDIDTKLDFLMAKVVLENNKIELKERDE